jgi:hypothetical protein
LLSAGPATTVVRTALPAEFVAVTTARKYTPALSGGTTSCESVSPSIGRHEAGLLVVQLCHW